MKDGSKAWTEPKIKEKVRHWSKSRSQIITKFDDTGKGKLRCMLGALSICRLIRCWILAIHSG